MIKSVHLKNWFKHPNKKFNFTQGLNLIKGENEAGKSLIFEAIDFALHGSVALRLPATMYEANLFSELVATINGVDYKITRTPKKVELRLDGQDEVLAKGTSAVNAEIRKLLGYNRNVFLVSNYSCQESISYLSTLKPAERKNTIDNVVGLTAVEAVIAEVKTEVTVLNRTMLSVKNREVAAPTEPFGVRVINADKLIDSAQKQILDYKNKISNQKLLRTQHENLLKNKPQEIEQGDVSGFIGGLTEQTIAETKAKIDSLNKSLIYHRRRFEAMIEPPVSVVPTDSDKIISGLTNELLNKKEVQKQTLTNGLSQVNAKLEAIGSKIVVEPYTEADIDSVIKHEEQYTAWLDVQRLKEKGSINCDHCGNEILLAKDAIKEHYGEVPEVVEKPQVSSSTMVQVNRQIAKDIDEKALLIANKETIETGLKQLEKDWYSSEAIEAHFIAVNNLESYEKSKEIHQKWSADYSAEVAAFQGFEKEIEQYATWHTDPEIEAHRKAIINFKNWQDNQRELENWKATQSSLEPFLGEDQLERWEHMIEHHENEGLKNESNLKNWSEYDVALEKYNLWLSEHDDLTAELDAQKLNVEALNLYKQKIKSAILPSVNAVATQWLKRMSEGKHTSVELTEQMEILVNAAPIEALSISGRALGHLSLRMALGQVLTNSVFPVFMADEVDASMRNERGQNVLNALTDMLKGSMKQVIIISHRELEIERVDNLIEL